MSMSDHANAKNGASIGYYIGAAFGAGLLGVLFLATSMEVLPILLIFFGVLLSSIMIGAAIGYIIDTMTDKNNDSLKSIDDSDIKTSTSLINDIIPKQTFSITETHDHSATTEQSQGFLERADKWFANLFTSYTSTAKQIAGDDVTKSLHNKL